MWTTTQKVKNELNFIRGSKLGVEHPFDSLIDAFKHLNHLTLPVVPLKRTPAPGCLSKSDLNLIGRFLYTRQHRHDYRDSLLHILWRIVKCCIVVNKETGKPYISIRGSSLKNFYTTYEHPQIETYGLPVSLFTTIKVYNYD